MRRNRDEISQLLYYLLSGYQSSLLRRVTRRFWGPQSHVRNGVHYREGNRGAAKRGTDRK